MEQNTELARLGVYNARAPRYTSYPTAVQFTNDVGQSFTKDALSALPIDKPVSVYIHIPFCERLCWFCACRTQGTKSASPVASYLDKVIAEIDLVAQHLPKGIKASHIHWGGGTPTILTPDLITSLTDALEQKIPRTKDAEFSVEIDPTLVDQAKIDALVDAGMTRASIGVQDFELKVQKAIGRMQSYETTQECIDMLRRANVSSLNMDILYGLPYQTQDSVLDTIQKVLELSPDRIALFGYAHVPWMAKRQQLIDEHALPNGETRYGLFRSMGAELETAGYVPIGIDHFAKPTDSMALAQKNGQIRRNFQGYTTDNLDTMIGLGASSISKYPNGYVQNAAKSSEYIAMINAGELAASRGVKITYEDRIIGRVIEMIMCDFAVDYTVLQREFDTNLRCIAQSLLYLQKEFKGFIEFSKTGFTITHSKRALARLIAKAFDQYSDDKAIFSAVS
ncbi:MAG: oxygen-independent coproporphyrinogen III oxidase [Amylibacter sp.]|nr:oxygen-independent coproporphyrinogen III oxidase [Amylibacter sp.]